MSLVKDYHVSLWKGEAINNEKEKTGMKKNFLHLVVGIGLGVLAASVSAETGTNMPKSSPLQEGAVSSSIRPLQSLGMGHPYKERREVSIDWASVLIEAVDLLYDRNHKDRSPGELIQMFSDSLRTILDLFEDRYDVRVIWKKADKNCPDVTDSFLEYAGNLQRLKDMCPLSRVSEYSNVHTKSSLDEHKIASNKLKDKESP